MASSTVKTGLPMTCTVLKTTFGGSGPVVLSQYYRGGSLVSNILNNGLVPTAGAIKFSDFYSYAWRVWDATTLRSTLNSGSPADVTGGTTLTAVTSTYNGYTYGFGTGNGFDGGSSTDFSTTQLSQQTQPGQPTPGAYYKFTGTDLPFGTSDFTFEFQLSSTDVSYGTASAGLVYRMWTNADGSWETGSKYSLTFVYVGAGPPLQWKLRLEHSSGWSITGTTLVTRYFWHHVAVCRKGTTVWLFLDGAVEATGTLPSASLEFGNATTSSILIGGSGINGEYYMGRLDDARAVKGLALYTAAFTAPTTALPVAHP